MSRRVGSFIKLISQSKSWCPSFHLKMRFHSHPSSAQMSAIIDYFTVVCLVTWPLDGNEARVDPACFDTDLTPLVV